MKTIFIILIIVTNIIHISGQYSINNSAGNNENNTGSITYSIGQISAYSVIQNNGSLLVGIQQPYEISVSSPTVDLIPNISIYPNPTTESIWIAQTVDINDIQYELISIQGTQLLSGTTSSNHHEICIKNLLPGNYILRLRNGIGQSTNYKIVIY